MNVELIKKNGMVAALKEAIHSKQRDLDSVWRNTSSNGVFVNLDKDADRAIVLVTEIKELLAELKAIDSRHS